MARDANTEAALAAIVASGRQTRKPTPRWMWIAAAVVGVLCAAGFAVFMLSPAEPSAHPLVRRADADTGSGLGTGLVIGAGLGIVIGFAITRSSGRQRGDHSSRNNP
jgi:drug/metabolite transporter (DMT)-like permease